MMAKRKKVLIDLYSLKHPNCGFGQIALNYARLFADVQRSGREPFDICFLLPNSLRMKRIEIEGVECYYERRALRFWQKSYWQTPKVDLWHSINQACRQYPSSPDTKHIFTIHDYNFLIEETPERVSHFLAKMQRRIDRADAVTFISHYTEQQVKAHSRLDAKLTRTIYNGVEPLDGKPQQRPSFVNNEKPFFFAIGQFFPKKKFDVLLDVMKAFPDKELYICGQNQFPYGQEIMRRIEQEHIENVHTPGTVSDAERVWLYANCQAYLFPSVGEGFGLPAIEAMQFGKPVFASNYQSLPEIVGQYGFVWPSLETEVMVKTIKEHLDTFYSQPGRSQQVKDYAATFRYEKHVEAYLQLYREILAEK